MVGGNAIAVVLFLWGARHHALGLATFVEDFSMDRPEQVFQMVFGRPVPDGVTDLQVAGRHYFIREWVWMRFHATDAALNLSHGTRR